MMYIDDFIETFYGDAVEFADMTVKAFQEFKKEKGIEEWDYPLEEFEHIAEIKKESGTNFEPVMFIDIEGGYDCRFCEVPEGDWR